MDYTCPACGNVSQPPHDDDICPHIDHEIESDFQVIKVQNARLAIENELRNARRVIDQYRQEFGEL